MVKENYQMTYQKYMKKTDDTDIDINKNSNKELVSNT